MPRLWDYRFRMPQDSKETLWANVLALMKHHYGKENLTRFSADVGIGPATATRIKDRRTSVGLDVLEKIAAKFSLEPWQLLVPGLDVAKPPDHETDAMRELRAQMRATQEAMSAFLKGDKPLERIKPDVGERPEPSVQIHVGKSLRRKEPRRNTEGGGQKPPKKAA